MRAIWYNGQVYTGEETLRQAFLVEDGEILAVGSDAVILALADSDTVCTDLGGRFVCPGFNDSHMHLLNLGQSLNMAQLAQHTDSLAGMLSYLRDYAAANPPRPGGWLLGRGWNQDYFTDVSRLPSRADLDEISAEIPILLTRACGHCCVVNSRVLEIAGITGDTPSPDGGDIGKENGVPDGRLYDNAIDLLTPFVPLPDKEELKDMIRLACRALNCELADFGIIIAGILYICSNVTYTRALQLICFAVIVIYITADNYLNILVDDYYYSVPDKFFALLAVILTWTYNGERGPNKLAVKVAYYVYFPLMLLILWLIKTYALA